MAKKRWPGRFLSVLLALFLAVPSVVVPSAYAEDLEEPLPGGTGSVIEEASAESEDSSIAEDSESEDSSIAEDSESGDAAAEKKPNSEEAAESEDPEIGEPEPEYDDTALTEESSAGSEEAPIEEDSEAGDVFAAKPIDLDEESEIGELTLVYGDKSLADKDALVLLILGDGFTADEQDDFYASAAETAKYIMDCSPYDEFKDVFKIYALGVVSTDSGARGESAGSQAEAEADDRETYFGASFWSYGMQRLLCISEEGEQKGNALQEKYLPAADYSMYLVNSTTYGGSGGDSCVASLNNSSLEMMLHEMGHTIGGLADEYYVSGYEGEYANLTAESDPDLVRWSRFIGLNGIGVYDWGGNTTSGYYIPSLNCKMQYLGQEYEFCEVCKEALRQAFCADSNVTKLFFQPYADEFIAGESKDMSEYFILRKGSQEITGDQLGSALTLTYYDADGNMLEEIPSEAGTYTVKAKFAGDETYAACSAEGTYTIETLSVSLKAVSKVQDGTPAVVTYDVNYDGEYSVTIDYYGYQYYSYYRYDEYYYYTIDGGYEVYHWDQDCEDGDYYNWDDWEYSTSTEGPTEPGTYTVYLTVYDEDENPLGTKEASYTISIGSTTLVDNNDYDNENGYYGAADYMNNKTIVIFGEGYTAQEQEQFEAEARKLVEDMLAIEPFKETQLYFNFIAVNSISGESGVGTEAKDSFFGLTYDENGVLDPTAAYYATDITTKLAYTFSNYYAGCIVLVNTDDGVENYTYHYDYGSYSYFHTIFVTPDESSAEYAASELLNHLILDEVGYRAGTEAEQEAQRLALISALHYEYAPIIVSRAYDVTFTENGEPIDLTPYFDVFYEGNLIPNVNLTLTYYDAQGNELPGAPSEAGTYTVLAETVPYDPYNEYETYWQWYVPEGADPYGEDGLWFGLSRGITTYTIQTAAQPDESDETDPADEPDQADGTDQVNGTDKTNGTNKTDTPDQADKTDKTNAKEGAKAASSAVETGDEQNPILWGVLLIAASAGLLAVFCTKKNKRKS